MYRLLTLAIILTICLTPGMRQPQVRPPRAITCDWILLPQYDSGGCMSVGNPNCSGLPGGDCCRHFHNPLTWNQAFHWIKYTGLLKGPSYKKYYSAHDDFCSGEVCTQGTPITDSVHYQTEDTLVGCP